MTSMMLPDAFVAGDHKSQYDPDCPPRTRREGCVPAAGANGARASSGGKVDRLVSQVHNLIPKTEETDPNTPGWSLVDLDRAMLKLGIAFETRNGTWSAVENAHASGLVVVLQGDSDQFPNGTCSGEFDGDHCVAVHPGTYTDGRWPLADGICPTRRPEKPSVLKDYANKFAIKVGGRPTSVIRFGVFTTPVPFIGQEEDVTITEIKGEDWKPTENTTKPIGDPLRSNGVLRSVPDRGAPILARLPLTAILRSIVELTADGEAWRVTEHAGDPAFFLRTDWIPIVPGGDTAVDKPLHDYIARLENTTSFNAGVDAASRKALEAKR